MHAVHKILSKAAGVDEVYPGEIIKAEVDFAGINDIYLMVANTFNEMGAPKVWAPDRVAIFMDHNAPASTIKGSDNQKKFREFAKKHGISNVLEINEGICHLVPRERGMIKPSDIVIITDSHTTMHGSFGAFSTGVGSTDMAMILEEGKIWLRVPTVIQIRLEGTLKPGVMAKDIALYLLGEYGTNFANYKVIEFTGPIVSALNIDERSVLTNMAVEMGAKATYIQPDEIIIEYVRSRTNKPFIVYETDSEYEYEKVFTVDVSNLSPQVALPHAVDNVRSVTAAVEAMAGEKIDQVLIGGCTGGKLTDIEAAAKVIKGKKVADGTRLIVTMASREILKESIEKGYYQILLEAGAAFTTPGCGACYGGHSGLLAAGERCVSTTNRNFPGRMGSGEAFVYLVSPLTAAATAVAGKLVDDVDM